MTIFLPVARGEAPHKPGEAPEVGGVHPALTAIAIDDLVECGVAIAELGKGDIESCSERGEEGRGAGPRESTVASAGFDRMMSLPVPQTLM